MKILAITSCPVGLAHTYMAAAALKKAAKKLGIDIKVETQGSMGIKDRITAEDLLQADLLVDSTSVAMIDQERFKDIYTIKTSNSALIKNADSILKEALDSIQK